MLPSVLYMLLNGSLPPICRLPLSRLADIVPRISIFAFAYNTWSSNRDVLMDVAWTKVKVSPQGFAFEPSATHRIRCDNMKGNPGMKELDFVGAISEKLKLDALNSKLKAFGDDIKFTSSSGPVILLVNNMALSMKIFREAGVKFWDVGLGDLMKRDSEVSDLCNSDSYPTEL